MWGELIVGTPEDTYRMLHANPDSYPVVENFLLAKSDQPEWEKDDSWKEEFELD